MWIKSFIRIIKSHNYFETLFDYAIFPKNAIIRKNKITNSWNELKFVAQNEEAETIKNKTWNSLFWKQ